MAPLVDHETASLAMVSLFSKSPDEVGAVATERRLLEELCNKFVVLHFMDVRGGRLADTYNTSHGQKIALIFFGPVN